MPTPHYGTPRYRRVADQLRDRITSGVLPPGALLPAETTLAKEFNVARGTIRQAINALRTDGLVTTEHGRGTYTRPTPTPPPTAIRRTADRHPQGEVNQLTGNRSPADVNEQPRYVIHIPINARDLTTAIKTAHTIAVTLAHARADLRELDYPETTVTAEGDQFEHHRVICSRQQPDGTRCGQLHAHEAPCAGSVCPD